MLKEEKKTQNPKGINSHMQSKTLRVARQHYQSGNCFQGSWDSKRKTHIHNKTRRGKQWKNQYENQNQSTKNNAIQVSRIRGEKLGPVSRDRKKTF